MDFLGTANIFYKERRFFASVTSSGERNFLKWKSINTGKGEFFCDTCDKDFKTEEKLQQHVSEHIVCGIDGCTLSAHEKIIYKHVLMQHKTGLYNRITKNDSPEAIENWIKERKKNYPTKVNIEKKDDKIEKMEKRGERIHADKSHFANKSNENIKIKEGNGKMVTNKVISSAKRNRHRRKRKTAFQFKDIEVDKQDTWRGNLPHFPGTASFPEVEQDEVKSNVNDDNFSDSEWNEVSENVPVNCTKPVLPTALSVLCAQYNSEESDEEQEQKEEQKNENKIVANEDSSIAEETIKSEEISVNVAGSTENEKNDDSDNSSPEEVAIIRNVVNAQQSENVVDDNYGNNEAKKNIRKRKRSMSKEGLKKVPKNTRFVPPHKKIPKRRLTLLQKLLEPEIRKERNIILQCIRHVVNNKFFGVGS